MRQLRRYPFRRQKVINGTIEIWSIKDGVVGSTGIFALPGEAIDLR